jgi:tRNA ligase
MHRSSLRDIVNKFSPPGRLVSLNWSLDEPPAMIHRICADRIQGRGENHQSLIPDEYKNHENALWMFIEQTQGLSGNEVDDIIEMDVGEDMEENLARAVDGLVRILDLERPSEEKIKEALTIARTYAHQPDETKKRKGGNRDNKVDELSAKRTALDKRPRYFGILPELDLEAIVGGRVAGLQDSHLVKKMWNTLKLQGRVTKRPHITLVHEKGLPDDQALWDRCTSLHQNATPPTFVFKLTDIVCNDRVMALSVEEIEVWREGEREDVEAGAEFAQKLPEETRRCLHITVGTAASHINPYEAKSLVQEWREGDNNVTSIQLGSKCRGRIKGLMS